MASGQRPFIVRDQSCSVAADVSDGLGPLLKQQVEEGVGQRRVGSIHALD
jgi:hypothetical protein